MAFLFWIAIGLSACHSSSDPTLYEAEKVMKSYPDSALVLLEAIRNPEKMPAGDYATWCLLVTQARDKNYVEHTSDSLIGVAVRYFEKRKDPHRKAQVYYCQGRVLSDLDLEGEALEAYLKAKEQAVQTIDYDLRARINNHLGGLYWKNMNYRESLVSYKEAHQAYACISDTAGMVNTLCNVGKCLQGMDRLDSASFYYGKALKLADEGDIQAQKGTVLTSLGNINMDRGRYTTALEYYRGALQNADNPKFLDIEYYNLGDIYHALGQTDSALFYLGKISGSEDLFTRCSANRLLYQLAKESGVPDSAFAYNETYLQLRDSIEHLYRPHELERMKALYNKERMQNRHDRQMQEVEIRQLVWVVLFLASLVVGTFIYSYFNKKLSLLKLRNQEAMKMLNENRRQLSVKDKELSENNARLEIVQQSLCQIRKEKDRLVKERDEQVRILEEDNWKQQAEYEQQLEEIETRSKRIVEEKEKILHEKEVLVHQKDLLLGQQDSRLSSMSKDEKLYKEQIGILTSEQQQTKQEMKTLRTEIDTLRLGSETQLQQELESKKDYSSLCKMYEAWQKELISQNSCLSCIRDRLVLDIWKERDWEVFMENFNQVYPGFLTHLTGSFNLTDREIRIVCLTKLGLKTTKVSTVFNLGEDMIRRIKSDIRKRCFPTSTAHSLDQIIKRWY
ncbi:tetratricopeptide repeat protein [uncultured Parabacteroides sp.]|uniref:tetratricopeptide repeat protein n=1 Tax=uncultured Parabacteroides sp. TaxID=512312 RepID=UPI0025D30420|nr:tetratricopeptide repeat protein [uncultured Parabacteroides sp.]